MTTMHDEFLELAAAAIDFELSEADRNALGRHLDECAACRLRVIGINKDQRDVIALKRLALSPATAQSIRTQTVRRQAMPRSTLRMLAIAAVVAALVVGAVVVGAQLIRRVDYDLTNVTPPVVPDASLGLDAAVFTPMPSLSQASPVSSPAESRSTATPSPSAEPTPTRQPSPNLTPKVKVTPKPAKPSKVVGWPSVARDGVELTAVVGDSEEWNGHLVIDVTASGLKPQQPLSLDSNGPFRIVWTCGDESQPSTYTMPGESYVPSLGVAGPDGTAQVRVEFAVSPDRPCPQGESWPWSTTLESWTVSIANRDRLLYLVTPEPLVRVRSP